MTKFVDDLRRTNSLHIRRRKKSPPTFKVLAHPRRQECGESVSNEQRGQNPRAQLQIRSKSRWRCWSPHWPVAVHLESPQVFCFGWRPSLLPASQAGSSELDWRVSL